VSFVHAGQVHGYLRSVMLGAVQIKGQESLATGEKLGTQAHGIPANPKAMAGGADKALLFLRTEVSGDNHIPPGEFGHPSQPLHIRGVSLPAPHTPLGDTQQTEAEELIRAETQKPGVVRETGGRQKNRLKTELAQETFQQLCVCDNPGQ
jgi:hypothetical protein